MRWIGDIDNVKSAWCCHVKTVSGGGNKCCARQRAIRVETNRLALFQEIIVGISIDERGDIGDYEPFFTVRDVSESVEEIDWLLFVFRNVLPGRIERERARQGEAGCVFGVNARALAERRDWRAD